MSTANGAIALLPYVYLYGRVAEALVAARDMLRLDRNIGEGRPSARREFLAEAIPVVDDRDSRRFRCDHRGDRLVSIVHGSDVNPICEKRTCSVVLCPG